MSEREVTQLLDHGFTMRIPARYHGLFAPEAATSLRGSETWVEANEFGIGERARMEVADAWVEDGDLVVVLRPVPLR